MYIFILLKDLLNLNPPATIVLTNKKSRFLRQRPSYFLTPKLAVHLLPHHSLTVVVQKRKQSLLLGCPLAMILSSMIMTMTLRGGYLTITATITVTNLCLVHKHPFLLIMPTRMKPMLCSHSRFCSSLTQTLSICLIGLSSLRTR